MPLSWKDYIKIRRLDLESYCENRNINSYDELISCLNKGDCVPPLESEVEHLFVKEEIKIGLKESLPGVIESISVEAIEPEPDEPEPKPKRKYTKKKKTENSQKTDISKRKPVKKTKKATKSLE